MAPHTYQASSCGRVLSAAPQSHLTPNPLNPES